ncbi:MAG: NAD(P)-binding protein [Candidatus Lokiarchaeota archaeon]|nr:NAD(P)-binding protein [Candidatus Lokiarchaeota archaeon]
MKNSKPSKITIDNITKFDCLIIGAGLSGLSAGLYLSLHGYKPLIIEQESQVGGYAVNFQRRHYRFEGSLHSIHGCQSGGFFDIFKELNLHNKINPLRIQHYKHEYDIENKKEYHWTFKKDQFVEEFTRKYPNDDNDIRKFFNTAFKMGSFLKCWNDIKFPTKIIRSLHYIHLLPTLLKNLNKSTQDLMESYFSNEKLINDLISFPAFSGSEPSEMSAIVYFSSFFEKFLTGSYYLAGGSGNLTKIMAHDITENGGQILLNHKVVDVEIVNRYLKRILIKPRSKRKNPFVIELYKTPVLYCCDPHQFKQYIKKYYQKNKFFKRLDARRTTDSIFQAYLGLDIDLKKLGYPFYSNVFKLMGNDLNTIIYSNIDPTCCPKGHSNLAVVKFVESDEFERLVEMDEGDRGKNYKTIKKLFLQEIIAELEVAMGIDLKNHVKMAIAATPITFQRYTSNFKGALAGNITSFNNILLHRLGYTSGVKNLYFASQWVGLGGGYHNTMQTGIKVAHLITHKLRRLKKKNQLPIKLYDLDEDDSLLFEELDMNSKTYKTL